MVSTVIMFGGIRETGKEEILNILEGKKRISKSNQNQQVRSAAETGTQKGL